MFIYDNGTAARIGLYFRTFENVQNIEGLVRWLIWNWSNFWFAGCIYGFCL